MGRDRNQWADKSDQCGGEIYQPGGICHFGRRCGIQHLLGFDAMCRAAEIDYFFHGSPSKILYYLMELGKFNRLEPLSGSARCVA